MTIKIFTPPPWTVFYRLNYISTKAHHGWDYTPLVSTAYPDTHSQFICDHTDAFSLRFLKEDKIYLIASSNGLVLCSTSRSNYYQNKYYVCNPLTRQWVSLPPPPPNCRHSPALHLHGFICASSSSSSSLTSAPSFKVVLIPRKRHPSTKFDIEIFCSDMGKWNTYQVSCPREVWMSWSIPSNVVSRNGLLYWFEGGGNGIIAYDLSNNNEDGCHQCRLIAFPKERSYPDYYYEECLGESEGFICFFQLQNSRETLSLWVLEEDYSNGEWVFHWACKISKLKEIIAAEKDGKFRNIEVVGKDMSSIVAFSPLDRNVVILKYRTNILACNMQTKTSEVLLYSPSPTSQDFRRMWHGRPSSFVLTPKLTPLPPSFWSDTN
ncbi:hypothetical protein BVC80_901g56 [Macleaya cordata]|uniref:F-box protein At3g26010-like beta-propeller domain-containing protein n=1 Tax=Macleaya cordata TaxID=56857 RepID=A0A200QEM8_MACCD|nr:hypothetical protein BVC80_901g56 [Macleaya cordata]